MSSDTVTGLMAFSSGCITADTWSQAFALVQILPWVIGLYVAGMSIRVDLKRKRISTEWFPMAFATYLFLWQWSLYIWQLTLERMRSHPFCPPVQAYGFPSIAGFYVAAAGAIMVSLPFLLGVSYSWFRWVTAMLLWGAPPTVLIWVGYNTWDEVLLSMGVGAFAAIMFVFAVHLHVRHILPYLLNTPPCTWLNMTDSWIQTKGQRRLYKKINALVQRSKNGTDVNAKHLTACY